MISVGARYNGFSVFLGLAIVSSTLVLGAQERGTQNGEWPSYGGDLAHTRYSPLDQVNGDNFNDLELSLIHI